MRRTDREITDRQEIDAIIHGSDVCRLALSIDGQPYLLPLSFGYDGASIYIHTAPEGRKIAGFEVNPRVCFEFERNVQLRRDPDRACKWSFDFESVIGFGTISELCEPAEKEHALDQIMRHYSGTTWPLDSAVMARTRVWMITIETMTGKRSQPKREPF